VRKAVRKRTIESGSRVAWLSLVGFFSKISLKALNNKALSLFCKLDNVNKSANAKNPDTYS
jgi:hypothetical protein